MSQDIKDPIQPVEPLQAVSINMSDMEDGEISNHESQHSPSFKKVILFLKYSLPSFS